MLSAHPSQQAARRTFRRRTLPTIMCALALSAGVLALTGTPALTQEPPAGGPPEISTDAQAYADEFGVAGEEAQRRLLLQDAAGRLEAGLSEAQPDSFAGLWITHEPAFRVVVRFKGDRTAAADALARGVRGGPLEGLVDLEFAQTSLEDLESLREEVQAAAAASGAPRADTAVDIRQNRVEVALEEPPPSPSALGKLAESGTDPVAVLEPKDAGEAEIRPARGEGARRSGPSLGGLRLSAKGGGYCTSGFSVRGANSSGVTTAAHCPAALYRGKTKGDNRLPFRAQRFGKSSDVQWHATPRARDLARVRFGGGHRAVAGQTPWEYQPVGGWVCKHGARTGKTCGTISGKWYAPGYVPNASPTFVGVASSRTVVGPGDSGGPFMAGNSAYGTAVAYSRSGSTHYGYYMPVDFLGSLGVRLITR